MAIIWKKKNISNFVVNLNSGLSYLIITVCVESGNSLLCSLDSATNAETTIPELSQIL